MFEVHVAARVVAAQRGTRRTHLRRRRQPYFRVIAPVLVGVLRVALRLNSPSLTGPIIIRQCEGGIAATQITKEVEPVRNTATVGNPPLFDLAVFGNEAL